jgi:hypothetical protein
MQIEWLQLIFQNSNSIKLFFFFAFLDNVHELKKNHLESLYSNKT